MKGINKSAMSVRHLSRISNCPNKLELLDYVVFLRKTVLNQDN